MFIFFLNVVHSKKIIPPLIENLFNTLKRTVIKKAIFDKTSQILGYRNIGHAATVMKGRVHKIDKLIALSESFKSEVKITSNTVWVKSEEVIKTLSTQIGSYERYNRAFSMVEESVLDIESNFKLMMEQRVTRGNQTEAFVKYAKSVAETIRYVNDAINKLNSVFSGTGVIHHQLSRNFFVTTIEYLESKKDVTNCETRIATMETFHTFVQAMILTLLKAKIVVKYGYNIKHLERNNFNVSTLTEETHLYKNEIEDLEHLTIESIERLLLNFIRSTKHLKPYSYNCRPSIGYLEHENYERFVNFLSNYFVEERYLRHPYRRKSVEFFRCSQDCPFFDLSTISDPNMMSCKGLMRDCQKFESNPTICRKTNSTQLFSTNTTQCPVNDLFQTGSKITPDFFKCDTCFCTCDTQIGYNFVYTGPILAHPGHVLAGIRLSKSRNTIFMSILSGKPLPMGFVDIRNSEWSELPQDEEPRKNRHKYFRISWWCRTFVLADVKLERYHVVTGVQFVINPGKCMIYLKVYGTMINVLYGTIISNSTITATIKPCE